ncbi:hypothetical protein CSOJ01_05217 [Colletotrichum sojae]|uniref:Uncharacterized protein n=1 Tax=Colletotrichum sojae TaxID=2175907 RepID=A0A8H6JGT0_9PEZI|nr:hypothetical protein CSOJ01_05217 [Colletotrichum sojae]
MTESGFMPSFASAGKVSYGPEATFAPSIPWLCQRRDAPPSGTTCPFLQEARFRGGLDLGGRHIGTQSVQPAHMDCISGPAEVAGRCSKRFSSHPRSSPTLLRALRPGSPCIHMLSERLDITFGSS